MVCKNKWADERNKKYMIECKSCYKCFVNSNGVVHDRSTACCKCVTYKLIETATRNSRCTINVCRVPSRYIFGTAGVGVRKYAQGGSLWLLLLLFVAAATAAVNCEHWPLCQYAKCKTFAIAALHITPDQNHTPAKRLAMDRTMCDYTNCQQQ